MLRRLAFAAFALLAAYAAACASDSSSGTTAGTTTPPLASGSPDASGEFVFADDSGVDAGVLLSACDPSSPTSCPTGFICYATHTSTSWWVDLYGKCTFDCSAATLALCSAMDGVCGCPVSASGTSEPCTDDTGEGGAPSEGSGEGGSGVPALAPMVCVPAVKPGTQPGSNEGEGGCGTPNCGGGAEAGSLPTEDAGQSDQ